MITNEITLEYIIRKKLEFLDNNKIYDKDEYKNYNIGEKQAYNEMLCDLEKYDVDTFVKRYSEEYRKRDLVINEIENDSEREKMIGYDNAVVSILELIDPEYPYTCSTLFS